ncbi:MAG: metallophosphoesterase [Elusimicrobia bacterium]|nr:metallophosphoesterase [Elusimicrobiota bacterium]
MRFHDDRRPPPPELLGLARRWRTERQLGRLARLPAAAAGTARFAVLGDVEPSRFWIWRRLFNREGVFPRQMAAIRAAPAAFVVQLGDMVEKGRPERYARFLRQLRRADLGRPYLTVIGNHDRSRPNGSSHSTLYRRLFGRANYAFDHAGTRFVVLDSSARRLTAAQRRWLRLVLDAPGRKVVFTHMPPAHLGLWGGVGPAHAIGGFTGGAREFSEIVSAARVSRVYMGHVHAFGVQDYRGVRYVLTGGGGSALFPSGAADRFHHFLAVECGPAGVRERVHALDGRSFEIPAAPVILPAHDGPRSWRRFLGSTWAGA